MTEYKLYYFNVTGLAEPIRYLLHYCGVDFEDFRINDFDEWKNQYREEMPMKQMPVLEINGKKKMHQHVSICRYFAKKFNLCGKNDEEDQKIDQFIYDVNDMRLMIANYYNEEDIDFKGKLKERMLQKLPFFLSKFNKLASTNEPYFFDQKITWAEIYYAGISEVMSNILKRDINTDYPFLIKLVANIRNVKNIKAYLEKRPLTVL